MLRTRSYRDAGIIQATRRDTVRYKTSACLVVLEATSSQGAGRSRARGGADMTPPRFPQAIGIEFWKALDTHG